MIIRIICAINKQKKDTTNTTLDKKKYATNKYLSISSVYLDINVL